MLICKLIHLCLSIWLYTHMKMNKHRDVTRQPWNTVTCKWSQFIKGTLCQFSSMKKQNTATHVYDLTNTVLILVLLVCQNQTATPGTQMNSFFFLKKKNLCQNVSSNKLLPAVFFFFLNRQSKESMTKLFNRNSAMKKALRWNKLKQYHSHGICQRKEVQFLFLSV